RTVEELLDLDARLLGREAVQIDVTFDRVVGALELAHQPAIDPRRQTLDVLVRRRDIERPGAAHEVRQLRVRLRLVAGAARSGRPSARRWGAQATARILGELLDARHLVGEELLITWRRWRLGHGRRRARRRLAFGRLDLQPLQP